jgi:hypothetical protein
MEIRNALSDESHSFLECLRSSEEGMILYVHCERESESDCLLLVIPHRQASGCLKCLPVDDSPALHYTSLVAGLKGSSQNTDLSLAYIAHCAVLCETHSGKARLCLVPLSNRSSLFPD